MDFKDLLKSKRKEYGFTLRELAKKIGFSHTTLSQLENGKRGIPDKNTVEKIADALDSGNDKLTEVLVRSAGYYSEKEVDSMLNAFSSESAPNVVHHYNENGTQHDEHYNFPINDINYHLTDTDNKKYFRKIELDDNDREYIDTFINGYLVNKLKVQVQTVKTRYANGQVDKEVHDRYTKETQELIDKLLDSDGLQY